MHLILNIIMNIIINIIIDIIMEIIMDIIMIPESLTHYRIYRQSVLLIRAVWNYG